MLVPLEMTKAAVPEAVKLFSVTFTASTTPEMGAVRLYRDSWYWAEATPTWADWMPAWAELMEARAASTPDWADRRV